MPKKTKISSFEEYLQTVPNQKEVMEFPTSQEAYEYGNKLRELIAKEQGVDCWKDCERIEIDISNNFVRIKLLAQEPACV